MKITKLCITLHIIKHRVEVEFLVIIVMVHSVFIPLCEDLCCTYAQTTRKVGAKVTKKRK